MKKMIMVPVLLIIALATLSACHTQNALSEEPAGQVMEATVLEVLGENQLLVEPVAGSSELSSADRIAAHTHEAEVLDASGTATALENYEAGSRVNITYDGSIAESYPAQIWPQKVQLLE